MKIQKQAVTLNVYPLNFSHEAKHSYAYTREYMHNLSVQFL